MRWLRRHIGTILCALIFVVGAGLLAYPTFSNWWNEQHQSKVISTYDTAVNDKDSAELDAMLAAAEEYNARLLEQRTDGTLRMSKLTEEQTAEYNSVLDLESDGVIGYIRIPKIDVELPIYHGTDDSVLQVAIGHLAGSSLPIGGKGTHAVLSGHRGLPSAKLFTDIDALGEGDVFMITCLGRKITYEVDQITTVLPTELDDLDIDPNEDYCTLVTCTPYGVNTHRLLVRGHRIDNLLDDQIETIQVEIPERELSDQERIQQILPYVFIIAAGLFGLALIMPSRQRPRTEDDEWADRRRDLDRRRGRRSEPPRRRERRPSRDDFRDDQYNDVDSEQWLDDDIEFYDADEEFYDED